MTTAGRIGLLLLPWISVNALATVLPAPALPSRTEVLSSLSTLKAAQIVRVAICPDGRRFTLGKVQLGLSPKMTITATPATTGSEAPVSPEHRTPQGFIQVQQGGSQSLSMFALLNGEPKALACVLAQDHLSLFVVSDLPQGVQVTRLNAQTREVEWEVISTSGNVHGADLAVDERGQPFVLSSISVKEPGASQSSLRQAVLVQRLSAQGQVLWSQRLISTGEHAEDRAGRLALQGQNAVWVTGQTSGWFETLPPAEAMATANAGQQDVFLTRLESGQGRVIAQTQFGSTQNDVASAIVTTSTAVWVAGHTYGALAKPASGDADAFVVKFNNLGQHPWIRQSGLAQAEAFTALSRLPGGQILAAGYSDEAGTKSGLTQVFDAMGNVLARTLIKRTQPMSIFDVASDNLGSVYVGGVSGSQALFSQLDADGRLVWALPFEQLAEHLDPEPSTTP